MSGSKSTNKAVVFKAIPHGPPKDGQDLAVEDIGFDSSAPAPDGGVTLQARYFSFDPYMRGRMRKPEVKSYSPAFNVGQPIDSRGIATVLKSGTDKFKEGDLVTGHIPVSQFTTIPKEYIGGIKHLEPKAGVDPAMYLGPLGMPGLTAYGSLYEIGKVKKGETIFISSAAGAVGQLVGQIAKHEGMHVIGSAGSDEKVDFCIKTLGFDGCFNYKKEKPYDALKKLCPKGIDVYFENVGGEQLEAAIEMMNVNGRIIACGMISQYSATAETVYPIKNLTNIVSKRLLIQGFIIGDWIGPKYSDEHQKVVSEWIAKGDFKPKLDYTEGMENGVKGLLGVFEGRNFGKALLKL